MHVLIGVGKANLSTAFASYSSFAVSAPFLREGALNKGKRIGAWTTTNVGTTDHNGVLHGVLLDVPEGTVVLVQASGRRNGSPVRDAAVFLALRAHGPLVSIEARLPLGRDNVLGESFTLFRANADILGVEDLDILGIEPSDNFKDRFMNDEEIDECFNVQVLMDGLVPKPRAEEVVSPEGVIMRALPQAPRRKMRIR